MVISAPVRARLITAISTALLTGALTAPTAYAETAGQYVRTESGRVRCWVMANDQGHGGGPAVAYEASGPMSPPWNQWENKGFPQAPMSGTADLHWDLVVVNAAGAFHWDDGNIGAAHPTNDVILNYGQTNHIQGWTILPSSDGTRFTNDGTGHGMFVSIENVYSF
jgi:hypothetical protein